MNKISRISDTHKGHNVPYSCVRVYDENDILIGEISISCNMPLKYLIDHPKSKKRIELNNQLLKHNVPQYQIDKIYDMKSEFNIKRGMK